MGVAWISRDTDRVYPDQTQKGHADADGDDTEHDADTDANDDADSDAVRNADAAHYSDTDAAATGAGTDDDSALWNRPRIDRSRRSP